MTEAGGGPGAAAPEGEPAAHAGRLSRRQVLSRALSAGALLGVSGGAGLLGSSCKFLDQAGGIPPAPGGLGAIEHVVILIQENRSFDHYFGTFPGVRGFDDPRARDGVGLADFAQPGWAPGRDPDGYLLPFHLDTLHSTGECFPGPNNGWISQHSSWDRGAMDGFVRAQLAAEGAARGPVTMGYYTRSDLAFYYALADAFTICDGYHCSVLGETDPNRFMSVSATLDPEGRYGGPVLGDKPVPFTLGWPTMPEQLEAAGVSWKVYQNAVEVDAFSVSDQLTANNVLAYFSSFEDRGSPLYQKAFRPVFPDELQSDVSSGSLPAVSWVLFESIVETDEHPPAPPEFGEAAVAQLLGVLSSNPDVWARTVAFITWDENGGFFDHVRPPTPPPGTPGEYLTVDPLPALAGGVPGPIGLGFRVPLLVVSPFSRGGWVCSDTFDHTSLLRFIETRFGVEVPNLSSWRRSATGDLTAALDTCGRPDTLIPRLPATSLQDPTVLNECPTGVAARPYPVPPNSWPHQEPGHPRRRHGCNGDHGRYQRSVARAEGRR